MITENKPLLSDNILASVVESSSSKEEVARRISSWANSEYMLVRAKDRELIQMAVDGMKRLDVEVIHDGDSEDIINAFLAAVKAEGFTSSTE